MNGQKHLIKCRCILPQFKRDASAPLHHFIVFSVINDDGTVVPKHAQCNNCGIIHRVTDICRSEIVTKESMTSIISIDDIKQSMPQRILMLLEMNNADIATWELAQFIVDNQRWGDIVILTSETDDSTRQGKFMRILGNDLVKIETFSRDEVI